MIAKIVHFLGIALFVALLMLALIRFTSKKKVNRSGDLVITPGASALVICIMATTVSAFMTIMLVQNDFVGPARDAWIFWGIYIFFVIAAIWLTSVIAFIVLFPVTLCGDVIQFTNWRFQKLCRDIREIEHVYEGRNGSVRLEFSDGQRLAIHPVLGGAEAILSKIYARLTEQLAEEFPSNPQLLE
jgi:hypothetical protein